jgi:hypothetical protein
MVLEQIVVLLVDPRPCPVNVPLLPIKLEILAPFWIISNVPIHLIFDPT